MHKELSCLGRNATVPMTWSYKFEHRILGNSLPWNGNKSRRRN